MPLDLLPIFPGAYGSVLRHVVVSTLLQTERAGAEVTVVFAANVASNRLLSCKI
jgi:hypothetical protein